MTVVDASVAVKWLVPEPGAEAAVVLLDTGRLYGPGLLRVEVAAAVTRKVRLGELTAAQAAKAYRAWREVLAEGPLELTVDEDLVDPAVELALELGHNLQDCLYLALAQRLGVPLVTADTMLVQRAAGVVEGVRLFGEGTS